ncbi:amino acid permease, partial [candidate division KSB1 bacterium]|nr:amino acid permease [candidate division KSB1 bacterium]
IAASAIAFVEYLSRAFPGLLHLGLLPEPLEAQIVKKTMAVLIIALFTFIHARGIKPGIFVQNSLTLIKVGLLAGFIITGFLLGSGSFNHMPARINLTSGFAQWKSIGLSLLWIMFAYSGWNASAYLGSEIKNPKRNIPLSLLLGTGLVMVLYLLMNLLYVYAIPTAEMTDTLSIAGLAAGKLLGPASEKIVSVLIAFALFSSLSAYILLGPRVYYAMAKDGLFFKFTAEVHRKYGVPLYSILFQGSIAALMVLFGTFDQLLTYMGFSLGIFPILAVLGVFKLERRHPAGGMRMGYPAAPFIYILAGLAMLFLSFIERPLESVIAIITVLAGVPLYWMFKKCA